MSVPPVVVALEPGPAPYAALTLAAEIAAATGAPLEGHALASGHEARRACRRLRLAGRRRGLEVSFIERRASLCAVSEAAAHASLLAVGRSRTGKMPGLGRTLALSRVLAADGPPLLVVSRRGRPVGERVLVADQGDWNRSTGELYALVLPLVQRLSLVRHGEVARDLDPRLELCLSRALAWDERILAESEADAVAEAVLGVAVEVRPSLLVVAARTRSPALARVLFPDTAFRAVCESTWPALVARSPASGWRVPLAALPSRPSISVPYVG